MFDDPLTLATSDWLNVSASDTAVIADRCADASPRSRATIRAIVQQVGVHNSRIEIDCSTAAIATILNVELDDDAPASLTLPCDVRLTRSGRAMRLIQGDGAAVSEKSNQSLIGLLIKARRWWALFQQGEVDIKTLARSEGVQAAYVTRILRLVFLSPTVVDAILRGATLPGVDVGSLMAPDAVSPLWAEQKRALLPG